MLKIDLDEKRIDSVIEENWKNLSLPHFSGIIMGSGAMIAMGQQSFFVDGKIQQHVYPICETSINSFLDFGNEFVEVTPFQKRTSIPGENAYAISGEGAMGNEGFVAVVNNYGLVWAGFFTISNPFYEIEVDEANIMAKSTHNAIWRFPLRTPWKVQITNEA